MVRYGEVYLLLNQEEKLRRSVQEDPVISFVDSLLCKALELRASDVHIQPEQGISRLRYRIDGTLYDYQVITEQERLAVVSRLKLLAHLDIAERRLPQDGKLSVSVLHDEHAKKNVPIDFRIATFPSIYGEKLVIRVLDRSTHVLDMSLLGLSLSLMQQLQQLVQLPYGLVLITGPTGSGKTTTLYALLSSLNARQRNIITIEDPVEYDLPGITQSQVNAKAGFTFENGLRSLLRQDPDVIMIGEIRDAVTMQIAIESALTGHLVLSTLHTNNAAGALTRCLDMGVEPFVLTASVTAVLAQRLVRQLCNACKDEETLSSAQQDILAPYYPVTTVWRAQGCVTCNYIGYKGRVGVYELLVVDDAIRSLILKRASVDELHAVAVNNGTQSLMVDGLSKVAQGITTLEEIFASVGAPTT